MAGGGGQMSHERRFLSVREYRMNYRGTGFLAVEHCKKSWRSSSTPASGDAGPKHTGVEQSFQHPCRKFYYKYRTFSTFFTSDRTSSLWLHFPRRPYCLQMSNLFDRAWTFQKQHAPPGLELAIFTSTILYSTTAPHFLPCLRVHWRIERVQRSYIFAPRCLTEVKQHD